MALDSVPETDWNPNSSRFAHLTAYFAGWAKADAEFILSALADDYVWDDPKEGRITKVELTSFLAGFKDKIDRLRNGKCYERYIVISDPVLDDGLTVSTGWWRFHIPGTSIEGVSCVRVSDQGVLSEHRAYWGKAGCRAAVQR